MRDLRFFIEQLTIDEALRSNMTDAQAVIWLRAACEHVQQAALDHTDLDVADAEARAAMKLVNDAIGKRVRPAGGSSGFG